MHTGHMATVGLSIESANVVGYQNENMGSKRSIFLNTFTSVDGSTMTLGDISANSFDDSEGEAYDVFDWTGFVPFSDFIQTMNTSGKFTGKFTYVPDGYVNENTAGWYAYADTSCVTPASNTTLSFTHGFVLVTGDGNGGLAPSLTFAGQVKADDTVVPVASSSMLSGNCSPVNITLGNITANSFDDSEGEEYDVFDWTGFVPFSDFIQVMSDAGKFIGKYTYVPAGYKNGNVAGWYEYTDTEFTTCVNSTTIKAGQAFVVVAGDGNGGLAPTITIPSAL